MSKMNEVAYLEGRIMDFLPELFWHILDAMKLSALHPGSESAASNFRSLAYLSLLAYRWSCFSIGYAIPSTVALDE
jgi:hypothetical protein